MSKRTRSSGDLDLRLAEWAHEFPVADIRRELDELRRQRRDLDARMRALGRKLAFWEAARRAALGDTGPRLGVAEPVRPPKRDAILHLLAEEPAREFKLLEIREELITRGWLAPGQRAAHGLEVAATTLAQRGEVERPRRGYYRARRRQASERAAA